MIDQQFSVCRFVAEYSHASGEHIVDHDLASFDLSAFQGTFGITDDDNPMFDCYPIAVGQAEFVSKFLANEVQWDFQKMDYFVEAASL